MDRTRDQGGQQMNDNDAPAKPWEIGLLVILFGLLIFLVTLSYLCIPEVQ